MGLTASIFHNPLGNCSNSGISSKFDKCCIMNADGPFYPDPKTPAVIIAKGNVPGSLKVVPAHQIGEAWFEVPGWNMMGGDYVATSDSRFGECARRVYADAWGKEPGASSSFMLWVGALPLHDRQE